MTKTEHEKLESLLNGKPWLFRQNLEKLLKEFTITEEVSPTKLEPDYRTTQQNKALWKFFGLVADALTARGVTMRKVFESTTKFDIPPSKDNVHDLWTYFQKMLYNTDSTRELKRQEQIDQIHKIMMNNLGETFGIDYIDFPNDETKYGNIPNTSIPYPSDYQPPTIWKDNQN